MPQFMHMVLCIALNKLCAFQYSLVYEVLYKLENGLFETFSICFGVNLGLPLYCRYRNKNLIEYMFVFCLIKIYLG